MKISFVTIQIIAAYGVFLLTWELWAGQYFYTASEKRTMENSRGKGIFNSPTLVTSIIRTTLFIIAAIYLFPN